VWSGIGDAKRAGRAMSLDRFCSHCRSPHGAADRFCIRCGQSFANVQQVALTVAASAQVGNGFYNRPVATTTEGAGQGYWATPSLANEAARDYSNPWLVLGLVSVSFGLYFFYWFFDTWRQIKRHDHDEGKSPIGHTLALFVPLYNLTRMHAHMRTIVEVVQSLGGETNLSPGWCVFLWIVTNALIRGSDKPGYAAAYFFAVLIAGAMAAWAQVSLNRAWR
jgi:hypothetical protein